VRPPRAASLAAVLAAVVLGGCSHGSAVSAPSSEPERFAQARPVAVQLIRALAAHRTGNALEAPAGGADRRSLDDLAGWLARIPISQLRVVASDVPVSDPNAAGVLLTLNARVGSAPASIWIDMGQRVLAVRDTGSGWKVSADISSGGEIAAARTGLGAITSARYVLGRHSVVIDSTGDDANGAGRASQTAEQIVPYLRERYGGGSAMARPVIVLVPSWPEAQAVANDTFPHEALGVEHRGFVYVDESAWRSESEPFQRALIVHELTHVATAHIVGGAPESLVEGIARYEEDTYLRTFGERWPLSALVAAYDRGYPSIHRWTQRLEGTWGLKGFDAISLAYDDAFAVVHSVLDLNGGIAAFKRLGAAFRRRETGGDFTVAGVDAAFRSALGVSFAQVLSEAHRFVRQAG
jgi:hypothetical protein